MAALLHDPTFWVAVAFVIVVAALARPASRVVSGALDNRTARIKAQLDEAQTLREEAQKTLADYKHRQRDALAEAEKIIEHAREEAERMRIHAEKDLEQALARRRQQAEEKIQQAEAAALKEVRHHAVDVAVSATARLLSENLDSKRAEALVDESIEELTSKLR